MAARPTALEAATRALARRDRSAADLVAYLERHGSRSDEAARAVERLRETGYVNDGRYATARADALADRGFGDAGISFELERDGVGADDVERALTTLVPERERALSLLRGATALPAAVRRLAAKGFAADSIEAALAAFPAEEVVELDSG